MVQIGRSREEERHSRRGNNVTKGMILVVFIELLVVGIKICCMCCAALHPLSPPMSLVEME